MGIGESKQVTPTTVACKVPRRAVMSKNKIYLMSVDGRGAARDCVDVRTTIPSFAPLGVLEAVPPQPAGEAHVKYTYRWPKPTDATLASLWDHAAVTLVVKHTPGPNQTHVIGSMVLPLDQMIGQWYSVRPSTKQVSLDTLRFAWHLTKEKLMRSLTREKWERWHARERPGRKYDTWEGTIDEIVRHMQVVLRDAICAAREQCTGFGRPRRR
jgi:hypothetical protein